MKTFLRSIFLAAFVAALVLAGLGAREQPSRARAGNGDKTQVDGAYDTAYNPDRQVTAYRSSLSSADSTFTRTAILALTSFPSGNRPTLYLQGRFSNSGATATVQVAYVNKMPWAISDTDVTTQTYNSVSATANTIKNWSLVYTLTGSTTQKEGAYYESNLLPLDMCRASTVRVLLISISAGSVDLWCGS